MTRSTIAAFAIGLLFGLGLCVSGMILPSKVKGFLDVAGAWDPSLAFVMGGAIGVGLIAFRFARGRSRALLGDEMRLPTNNRIDAPLVIGATIFGAGWGLAGVCPGPAIVDLAFLEPQVAVFVLAMLAGMAIEKGARGFIGGAR
ncbi:hypothetical protein IY145_22910 [Methylosinus sp. H3A]|uniref:DUF6691 family protein n=1 Tax=Methylosinus sp. H3A TaxID=2785786 RepID=UPI0018C2E6FF|nr:DUF6691 family protein [Methylosinus sp. H3A]MBG0812199.1 hypothetical protein [Methylosinus sp. H3A]